MNYCKIPKKCFSERSKAEKYSPEDTSTTSKDLVYSFVIKAGIHYKLGLAKPLKDKFKKMAPYYIFQIQ